MNGIEGAGDYQVVDVDDFEQTAGQFVLNREHGDQGVTIRMFEVLFDSLGAPDNDLLI